MFIPPKLTKTIFEEHTIGCSESAEDPGATNFSPVRYQMGLKVEEVSSHWLLMIHVMQPQHVRLLMYSALP